MNKYQAQATSAKNQEYAAKVNVVKAEQDLNYSRLSNEAQMGSQFAEGLLGFTS
jgi:hypothetical protein